ncbi:hypothetical protein [uncultured Litoreibacter sp.]|uniref:hypothetical protein n=1 Tax=uncultured Litoreibacter sp. TaxID=1392394 RepID=UPI002606CCD2|nr:hypothetical protein [uncultured Litoreibacter sp.]
MRLLIAFALTVLASCTTFEDIDDGLDVMRGQKIDTLISILGYPAGERTVAGRRLVVWNTDRTFTTTTPVTTYNSGNASAYGSGGYAYGNYSGTSTTYVPTTVNYNCTILVEIDKSNRILSHQFEGNIGGCERYATSLKNALGPKIEAARSKG